MGGVRSKETSDKKDELRLLLLDRMSKDFIKNVEFETYKLFLSWMFHLIFFYCSCSQVIEISESRTKGKGSYCSVWATQIHYLDFEKEDSQLQRGWSYDDGWVAAVNELSWWLIFCSAGGGSFPPGKLWRSGATLKKWSVLTGVALLVEPSPRYADCSTPSQGTCTGFRLDPQ